MRVAMFVYNNCTRDARVFKEASTLVEAGHAVTVFAVLDKTTTTSEQRDGFSIVRIDRDPPHYKLLRVARRLRRGRRLAGGRVRRTLRRINARLSRFESTVRGGRRPFGIVLPIGLVGVPVRRLLARWYAVEPASDVEPGFTRPLWHRTLLRAHKPLMFLDYYRRAYRVALCQSFEVFHAHDLNTLPVASALATRTGAPLIYDAHELYPDISTLSRLESRVWRLIERRLIGTADEVLTVCESISEVFSQRYSISPPTVLLNAPRPRGLEPSADNDDRELFRELGLDAALPVVLYQGGFSPHRGLRTLVLSMHELTDGILVLMGWGSLEAELRSLVDRSGLEQRVLIAPPVPQSEVLTYCRQATVGVIPYEPRGLNNLFSTPNKLFDFMMAGVPVVGTSLPEMDRFILGCDIGVTVPPSDPAQLGTALRELIADPQRRHRMSENARAASRRFSWDVESAKLVDVYARQAQVSSRLRYA
jgi:glycosyltransferase involved in cell wall biosynthesis